MDWPQIATILWLGLGVGAAMAQHGKPRDAGNAWYAILGAGIFAWLLYKGGFWS